MGLDMYLEGEKFYWTDWENPDNNLHEDGFRLFEKTLRLGYWRKHPDLHGYIVETFADGEDNCQKIYLTEDNILQIIEAIKNQNFPQTVGFFFGESTNDPEQQEEATLIFTKALEWLKISEENVSRSVYYEASW